MEKIKYEFYSSISNSRVTILRKTVSSKYSGDTIYYTSNFENSRLLVPYLDRYKPIFRNISKHTFEALSTSIEKCKACEDFTKYFYSKVFPTVEKKSIDLLRFTIQSEKGDIIGYTKRTERSLFLFFLKIVSNNKTVSILDENGLDKALVPASVLKNSVILIG